MPVPRALLPLIVFCFQRPDPPSDLVARRRNAVGVQSGRDVKRGTPSGVFVEDAADDPRLLLDDHEFADARVSTRVLRDGVAVAAAAAAFSVLHPALQTAMGLLREGFEKERADRAGEADMHRADPAVIEGLDRDIVVARVLEEAGDVLLIARDAVEAFGEHDLELAGSQAFQDREISRPVVAASRHRLVRELADDVPSLPRGLLGALGDLVADRLLVLHLGGVAGVDDRARA